MRPRRRRHKCDTHTEQLQPAAAAAATPLHSGQTTAGYRRTVSEKVTLPVPSKLAFDQMERYRISKQTNCFLSVHKSSVVKCIIFMPVVDQSAVQWEVFGDEWERDGCWSGWWWCNCWVVGGRREGGRAAQYLALLEASTNLGDCCRV